MVRGDQRATKQGEVPGRGMGVWRWWVWDGEARGDTQAVSLRWLHSKWQCRTDVAAVEASWDWVLWGSVGH